VAESFDILSTIRNVEIIAAGQGVRSRKALNRMFGAGRWKKMKGVADLRLDDGRLCEAEVHWYEAHGIGRVLFKRKRTIKWV
jgi:hypothetical protein